MVILSTLVSAIVESIFQLRNKRQDYFREIISRLFDDIIWRRLSHAKEGDQKKSRDKYLNVMLSVTGLKPKGGEQPEQVTSDFIPKRLMPIYVWFCDFRNFRKVEFWKTEKKTERLTSIEFASRFAKTPSGKVIYRMGEDYARIIVADLVRSFDDLSIGSTSDFRVRARKWSLWIGLGVVVAFNVDAFHLFKQLNINSTLTEHIIAATPEILKEIEESEHIDGLRIEQINKTLSKIDGSPVGWQNFPNCSSLQDMRCSSPSFMDFVFWVFGLGSAAIFIGLGSPFWFQVFQRMSVAAQLVSGLSTSKKQPMSAKEEVADNAAPLYQEAVEAFILAAKAEAIFSSGDSNSYEK